MNFAKNFILFSLLVFAINSCKNKSADLEKFESMLGSEKSEVLTELMEDFENGYLAKKYPNHDLQEMYLRFMEDIVKDNWPDKNEVISKENDIKYNESGLMLEKYLVPDSVWIEEYGIATKWTNKDKTGKAISYESFRPVNSTYTAASIDSIFESEKNIVKFNLQSNYTKAIEAVKDESPFLKLYYHYLKNSSMIGNSFLLEEIKKKNINISGQVERRVIVMHLVY